MLGLCRWCVLEADECLRYVIKHGDMNTFVDVVPVDSHSEIVCAAPVLGAFVVFFQDAGKVLNIFTANVFDAKVIYAECEGYPQRPKRRDSQRNSDQNCTRTEDVLAITVRWEFLFRRKVGRNSTKNKAILERTLSISTLCRDQNHAFSGIAPTLTSPILLNFAQK